MLERVDYYICAAVGCANIWDIGVRVIDPPLTP
jgi:hypothetical protein